MIQCCKCKTSPTYQNTSDRRITRQIWKTQKSHTTDDAVPQHFNQKGHWPNPNRGSAVSDDDDGRVFCRSAALWCFLPFSVYFLLSRFQFCLRAIYIVSSTMQWPPFLVSLFVFPCYRTYLHAFEDIWKV